MSSTVIDSVPALVPGATILDEIVEARGPWSAIVKAGDVLTIVDLHGNQAVDTLIYGAHDTSRRYSAQTTITAQRSLFVSTGTVLRDSDGGALMTVVADEVGNHDTVGGACSQESNTLRYGHHTRHQHACVENFLIEGARYGLGKRDLAPNLNFFMNVPVEADGTLGIVDPDTVDASNLQRQVIHATSRVGQPKVDSAEFALRGTSEAGPVTITRKIEGRNVTILLTPLERKGAFAFAVTLDKKETLSARLIVDEIELEKIDNVGRAAAFESRLQAPCNIDVVFSKKGKEVFTVNLKLRSETRER